MKILFVHNALTTFVRIDRDLLSETYELEELYLQQKTELNPFSIWRAVQRNDLVFGWFASWHTLLPILYAKWQGKPSILLTGGYDTANVPEASYGHQRKPLTRALTNWTIRNARRLICNSNFTKEETMRVSGVSGQRIDVVYHGLPDPLPRKDIPKENIALNVGNVSQENLLRKGIRPFLETAPLLPDFQFIQVGKWRDESGKRLLEQLAPNAQLRGFISREELHSLYTRSKFYVQPSLHEGFGMSVVEAMQYGCIPVVSQHGALPEVVREHGIVMESNSPAEIAKVLCSRNIDHNQWSRKIQSFVLTTYTLAKRRTGLINAIQKVLQ